MEPPPTLTYQVIYSSFFIPAPGIHAAVDTASFTLRLSEGTADAWITGAVASPEEARSIVEPYLRSWEMKAGSERGYPAFRFQFRGAHIPLPGGKSGVTASIHLSFDASLALVLDEFPPPPTNVPSTPWAQGVWDRFCRYREGSEPLVPTTYLCLTMLFAASADQRGRTEDKNTAAARVFGLPRDVLRKVGELTARPDLKHGRKISGSPSSLSEQELQFIDGALISIVRAVIAKELAGP